MPRFSIVVPAYEAAATLPATLDSIRAQNLDDWECIVVDDGSSDRTLEIATAFGQTDARIRSIRQENQGTAGAYNTGVMASKASLIAICSADDILLPAHLSTMSRFIETEPGYDIYVSNGYVWRPGKSQDLVYREGKSQVVHSLLLADVIRVCFYGVGAVYRRAIFDRVGGYRLDVFGEDYDFWLRAMALGARHRYTPEALSLFRISAMQKSSRLETVYRSDIRLVSELRDDFALSPEELKAVEDCIQDRERLIADLNRPWNAWHDLFRPAPKRMLIGAIGLERARRLKRAVRAIFPRAG